MRCTAALALAAALCALEARAETLTVLHTNDFHSRIEPINKYDSTCSAEDDAEGKCFGGSARLATAIRDQQASTNNWILVDGGDQFQGSLFYSTYKGKAEAEFLNLMKFDAMTVGNHEFDDGEEALVPFLEEVTFPVLSANVHPNAQSKVGDKIKPSLVLDVGGQKIGIVGAVTTDTPEIGSPGPNIAIEDDIKTITAEVGSGKAQISAHFNAHFGGGNPIIRRYAIRGEIAAPATFIGDVAVAHGTCHDEMELTSGRKFALDGKWSATILNQQGKWRVACLHFSTNVLDNAVLSGVKRLVWTGAVGGFVLGGLLVFVLSRLG